MDDVNDKCESSLSASQVSQWLDTHPEFLNEYILKIQQQRRSSIFNDQSSQKLLADLNVTCMSNNSIGSGLSESPSPETSAEKNEFAASFQNALNASMNCVETQTSFTSSYQTAGDEDSPFVAPIEDDLAESQTNKSINQLTSTDKTRTSSATAASLFRVRSHTQSFHETISKPSARRKASRFFANQQSQQPELINKLKAKKIELEDCKDKLGQIGNDSTARKQFKQLSLYEKMNTLVKTLYQSLNLKTTCKKILNTVSLLLDADRCSLFLVVDDENMPDKKCLLSVVFDAHSSNSLNKLDQEKSDVDSPNITPDAEKKFPTSSHSPTTTTVIDDESNAAGDQVEDYSGRIRIPFSYGIAGHVASTGRSLNISNVYEDERFNPTIDQQTGYKTRSILCLPILNENGECIAVAEAINKLNDNDEQQHYHETFSKSGFSQQDEEIFGQFMPFIAIAIRNSNLYAQSRKEAQTNKVLLELATIVFDESSTTVDNLVSRILFNSIFLLECERCDVILLNNNRDSNQARRATSNNNINAYFDRIYELNYTELEADDAFSNGIIIKPRSPNFSMNSPEIHIINQVIQTGQILNIKNLRDDPKFVSLAEDNKTNSLLCIPVNNSSNQVVALIFACNKMKTSTINFFSQSDINVAEAFALFCGIGIQNIMMYEKVVRAMNMQQVALDVLSYHASSNQEEVVKLAQEKIEPSVSLGLHSFSFDENTLDDTGTLKACISMFNDLGLIEKFKIPHEILCRFFLTVKKNYRPVAYHNWRHGFNVMSSMFQMFTLAKYNNLFDDLEVFSLLIACICHDLDHRGTTNNFQIKIQSPLAKLYTTSTMEHHHFNQCIIILHNNMNNILMNLSPKQHSIAIDLIEKAILATDLSLHFKHIDKFLDKANSQNPSFESSEDKELLANMLMTACDLSGGTKQWDCHYRLSNLVSKEFFNEGDLEKEKFKMEPIDSMNRNKSDQMPTMQIQFLQSVCIPLYHGFTLCNPLLKELVDTCESNVEKWKKLVKNQNSLEIANI